MKNSCDFRKGRRGAVVPAGPGKTRITIRIDNEVLKWFKAQVHASGGGSYQTLMNQALRIWVEHRGEPLEDVFRCVLREEMPGYGKSGGRGR